MEKNNYSEKRMRRWRKIKEEYYKDPNNSFADKEYYPISFPGIESYPISFPCREQRRKGHKKCNKEKNTYRV
jgi:hypothetical protein